MSRLLLGLAAAIVGIACPVSAQSILTQIDFSGGTIGQTLADTTSINGFGMVANFDATTNPATIEYVAGLSGTATGTGNAIAMSNSSRFRMIIDRTTPEWVASGLVGTDTLIGSGSVSGSLYGSVLIKNDAAPSGFAGLEFAAGDPNGNRVITLGEAAPGATTNDFVVFGPGQATGDPFEEGFSELALPTVTLGGTREIIFRIDYGADSDDTFTLLNPDGSDTSSTGTGSFQFSTLHLAAFGGTPTIVYDDIRLADSFSELFFEFPQPTILGDADGDFDVDLDDYVAIRDNFFADIDLGGLGDVSGDPNDLSAGDGFNGVVDLEDYVLWKRAFEAINGPGSAPSLAAVPEPTSLFLVAVSCLGCLRGRVRHPLS